MKKEYFAADIYVIAVSGDVILFSSGSVFYTADDLLDSTTNDIFEGWWLL